MKKLGGVLEYNATSPGGVREVRPEGLCGRVERHLRLQEAYSILWGDLTRQYVLRVWNRAASYMRRQVREGKEGPVEQAFGRQKPRGKMRLVPQEVLDQAFARLKEDITKPGAGTFAH
jgi:hypothetical protein